MKRGRTLVPTITVLCALVILPLIGPLVVRLIAPGPAEAGGGIAQGLTQSYSEIRLQEALEPPSARHFLGTDTLGRDVLARLIEGGRVSLLLGFGATLMALALGALLGGTAALKGGTVDLLLGRVIEVLGCFPPFILALALITVASGQGLVPILVAIALGRAASTARFVRGEIQRWRGAGLWVAARASGAGLPRVAFRHLLPLAAGPLAVQASFGVAQSILLESGLSFLGLGVQPPTPSWGMMLAEGRAVVEIAWWPILFPSAAIAITLAFLGWAASRLTD